MRYCFNCDERISEETLEKYPDTEICGGCIDDTDVEANIDICYIATNQQTGEVREGSFDDLSNLEKRVWELKACIWKEPSPLCVVEVWTKYEPSGVPDVLKEKAIYNMGDLVGIYI
jgi:hypothetical protein